MSSDEPVVVGLDREYSFTAASQEQDEQTQQMDRIGVQSLGVQDLLNESDIYSADESATEDETDRDHHARAGATATLNANEEPTEKKDSEDSQQPMESPADPKDDSITQPSAPSLIVSEGDRSELVSVSKEKRVSVRVATSINEFREITVDIIPATAKKPFLGGFRSKKTGVEYHNASSQTPKKIRPKDYELFHRQTQTVQLSSGVTNNQQTARTSSTQMSAPGCFVSSIYDRTIVPRSYETADEREKRILVKIIILQSYWRRWLAIRVTSALRAQRIKYFDWKQNEIKRKIKSDEDEKQRTLQRRVHPTQKQDFDLLLNSIQTWRQEQLEMIATLPADKQALARTDLQRQEMRYLTSVERLKFLARTENKETSVTSFLDRAAEPRKWVDQMYNKVNQMETPTISRARQLRDLYRSLQMEELTREERLAAIDAVKLVVKEYDTKLTKEITELLEREELLLKRGTKFDNMEGLRKRSLNLFLLFCETPEFNPEAARLLKVHQSFTADVRLCAGCGRFLSSKAFDAPPSAHALGRCRQCCAVHNIAVVRNDSSPFEAMLERIQKDESKRAEPSRLCFLMNADDVRTLVEKIWAGRSALSQHAELHHLTLSRWNINESWTPWNCFLVTMEEAAIHATLPNPQKAYADALISRIQHRFTQAKMLFRRLAAQDEVFGTAIAS